MAWPCISRVCCLARFWSQLDKSDLSVPLTIHNYSDIEEPEDGGPRPPAAPPPRGRGRDRDRDPSARGGSRHPATATATAAAEPFAAETQYRRDFRAWPLPPRRSCPWVGAPATGRAACALPGAPAPQRLRPRCAQDGGNTSSYSTGEIPATYKLAVCGVTSQPDLAFTRIRQEYRPWTGAKPSKPIKTKQGFIIPEDHFVQETSYKADFKIPEVKTRFSPNPSAVFQAPSRILNV